MKLTQELAEESAKSITKIQKEFYEKINFIEARFDLLEMELKSYNIFTFFKCPKYKSKDMKPQPLKNHMKKLESCNTLSLLIFIELSLLFMPIFCASSYFKYNF